MANIIVGIGRNRPDGSELSDQEWAQFSFDVDSVLYGRGARWEAAIEGDSISRDWKPEHSQWVAYTIAPIELGKLRVDLARLARKYRQAAIALTVGVTEFIESAPQDTSTASYVDEEV